jgi:RNA polymerase sigma-70 factor (family 1)
MTGIYEQASDKVLLTADDEQAAFRVLYDRYWQPLYHKALQRLGSDADAQDMVQEVFISCWNNRRHIEIADSLAAYLFTALKYCILKRIVRRAGRGLHSALDLDELEQTDLSTEEFLRYRELQGLIAREVEALPERMRTIYKMSRVEQLPIAEIAGQLGLSPQTVKNTLHLILKRLRKRLGRHAAWIPILW